MNDSKKSDAELARDSMNAYYRGDYHHARTQLMLLSKRRGAGDLKVAHNLALTLCQLGAGAGAGSAAGATASAPAGAGPPLPEYARPSKSFYDTLMRLRQRLQAAQTAEADLDAAGGPPLSPLDFNLLLYAARIQLLLPNSTASTSSSAGSSGNGSGLLTAPTPSRLQISPSSHAIAAQHLQTALGLYKHVQSESLNNAMAAAAGLGVASSASSGSAGASGGGGGGPAALPAQPLLSYAPFSYAQLTSVQAQLCWMRGDYRDALRYMELSHTHYPLTAHASGAVVYYNNCGCVYYALRKYAVAGWYFAKALSANQRQPLHGTLPLPSIAFGTASGSTAGSALPSTASANGTPGPASVTGPSATLAPAPFARDKRHEILYNCGLQMMAMGNASVASAAGAGDALGGSESLTSTTRQDAVQSQRALSVALHLHLSYVYLCAHEPVLALRHATAVLKSLAVASASSSSAAAPASTSSEQQQLQHRLAALARSYAAEAWCTLGATDQALALLAAAPPTARG